MEVEDLISLADPESQTEWQTERWHPKLTPYRFLILSTTIGLGSAKAYTVSQNQFLVAISIEWVTAVVVFSILFVLGFFELNPDPPRMLKWLLIPDLVPVCFRMLSQTPPEYRTDERTELDDVDHPTKHRFPPVTGYRFVTSVSVTLFGIVKAYFSYQNNSPAANAFDWSFGIIITSCLYILGLYEKNPVNLMPYLFSDDNPVVAYSTLLITVLMGGIAISSLAYRFLWQIASGWSSSYVFDSFQNFGLYLLVLDCLPALPLALFYLTLQLLQTFWPSHLDSAIRRNDPKFLSTILGSIFFAGVACISLDILMRQFEKLPDGEGAMLVASYMMRVILFLVLCVSFGFFSYGSLFLLGMSFVLLMAFLTGHEV